MSRAFIRSLVLAAALAAPVATGAFAQSSAPNPNVATAQITPAHLAVAREAVQLSGITRSFDAIIPQFSAQIKQSFSATRPEIAKDLDATLVQLDGEFQKQKDEMVNNAARVYAFHLSQPDLTEMVTFFKSPAGKRYVEVQPQMLDDLFGEMQGWSQKLSEFMVTRLREELKKKNIEI